MGNRGSYSFSFDCHKSKIVILIINKRAVCTTARIVYIIYGVGAVKVNPRTYSWSRFSKLVAIIFSLHILENRCGTSTVLRMRSRMSRSKPQRKEERLPRMTRIQQISRIKNYELQNKKFVV